MIRVEWEKSAQDRHEAWALQFCRRFPDYNPVVVCLEPIASDLSSQISVLPAAEMLGLSRGS
jgi:hypothetical protein